MVEFYSDEEIKNELDSPEYQDKLPAFAGRKYPIEYLGSREFEILLYFLYKKEISSGIISSDYDFILLMKGTSERGRDIILQKENKNVGLIQCKRYADLIQKPELAREIIKFVLHYLQDLSLISDTANFTYFFVALNGFNDKALDLLKDFNSQIVKESKLKTWTETVLEENESLKFDSYEDVEARLIDVLSKIKVRPINGVDIDQKLKSNKEIVSVFFEVEKVASQQMLDDTFKKYVGFKNDEDLERLRVRLQDLPKENRMFLGLFSVYGYDENFYKTIANDRDLIIKVADLKSSFNQKYISYLHQTIEKYQLIYITGLQNISPFSKQAVVPYLFKKYASEFQSIEMGKVFFDAIKKKSESLVPKIETMEEIKKHLLEIGEMVLRNDFSSFYGDGQLLQLKKDLAYWTHKEFTSVNEMSQRFDEDMIFLKPIIERIEQDLDKILPKNPTIIIENPNMLDSPEDLEKFIKEANRFDSANN